MCNKALTWCSEIATSPPPNCIVALDICADYMKSGTAVTDKNVIDIQTAQVLSRVLPSFISSTPNRSAEDSYVHHYVSPLLWSILSTDCRFQTEWANASISSDSKSYKSDFKLYGSFLNVKCVVLVSEFKPTKYQSSVESDLVKLARQMKLSYNHLVIHGVPEPLVCGLLCDGLKLTTFVLDLVSPQLYRLVKLSETDVFANINQLNLIPAMLYHLNHLKNIVTYTLDKAEASIIRAVENLKRDPPSPPTSWLSIDTYRLARRKS